MELGYLFSSRVPSGKEGTTMSITPYLAKREDEKSKRKELLTSLPLDGLLGMNDRAQARHKSKRSTGICWDLNGHA